MIPNKNNKELINVAFDLIIDNINSKHDENILINEYNKILFSEINSINRIIYKYTSKTSNINSDIYSKKILEECKTVNEIKNYILKIKLQLYCYTIEKILNSYHFDYSIINNQDDPYLINFNLKNNGNILVNFKNLKSVNDLDNFISKVIFPIIISYYKNKLIEINKIYTNYFGYRYIENDIKSILCYDLNYYKFYQKYKKDILENSFDKVIKNKNELIKNLLSRNLDNLQLEFIKYYKLYRIMSNEVSLNEFLLFLQDNIGNIKANDEINLFLNNDDFKINVICKEPLLLDILNKSLINDEDFMLNLIKINNNMIKYIKDLKYNYNFINKLCLINYKLLQYVDQNIFKNEEFLLCLIETNYNVLELVNYDLKNNYDFMLKAINKNVKSIEYIGFKLKCNIKFLIEVKMIMLKNNIKKIRN